MSSISNHYDFVDPKSTQDYAGEIARNGQRLITFILYLNDDYEGGETAFPKLGLDRGKVRWARASTSSTRWPT